MAITSEDMRKFIIDNGDIIKGFGRNGWITPELGRKAVNPNNEYTLDEQQDAFKQIYDVVKSKYAGRDFTGSEKAKQAGKFFESFTAMFEQDEINEDDWQSYDNKQMSKLADKMGYNWKNPTDRSNMMQRLQDKAIRKEKVKAYKEDKKNSPVSTFVTEMVAPNVTTRLSKGENIEGRDYVLDALNAGTMVVPSIGGKKTVAALLGTDIAQSIGTGLNTGAIDKDVWNDKADLAMAVGFPLVGHAAGQSTELLKKLGDIAKGSFEATQVGGKVLDNMFDPVLDALEDTKAVARKQAERDIRTYNNYYKDMIRRFGVTPKVEAAIRKQKVDELLEKGLPEDVSKSIVDQAYNNTFDKNYSQIIELVPGLKREMDVYTSRTGALPHDTKTRQMLEEQSEIAKNALKYLDEKEDFQKLSDEDRQKVIEFLKGTGMPQLGSRGKERIQSIAKSVSKPLIEGPAAKYLYRDNAINEKNEQIKKQAEEIVNTKAGSVYNYYKGRPNDLTEEEIRILKAAEVL